MSLKINSKSMVFLFFLSSVVFAFSSCKGKEGSESSKEKKMTASAGEEMGEEELEGAKKEVPAGRENKIEEKNQSKQKKILMIIACDGFRDEELNKPKGIFEEKGFSVTVASNRKAGCRGMMGGSASVDLLISEVSAKDFDAVVFVGGVGAKVFFDEPIAKNLAQDAVKLNKVVGAICIAPSILANAGVLNGKKATVWEGSEFISMLKKGGATFTGESVTSDGKIVTANGPNAASAFGNKIVELLSN